MKREQMILLIAECLVEPHFEDAINEAEYILRKIEKAGMLPPIEPDRTVSDLDLGVPRWEDDETK